MAKNPRLIDLNGQRFGMWLVGSQAGNTVGGAALWSCICDCGTERAVMGSDLRSGKSKGCGCVSFNRLADLKRTHGQSGSRLHTTWKNMRGRCYNPKRPNFKDYGGRGITICSQWADFSTFQDWALKSGYRDDLTIERVDVDGNYTPENCTWANAATQSANRRYTNKAPDGELWIHKARKNGISNTVFRNRAHAGWPMDVAISWPHNVRRVPRERDSSGKFI